VVYSINGIYRIYPTVIGVSYTDLSTGIGDIEGIVDGDIATFESFEIMSNFDAI